MQYHSLLAPFYFIFRLPGCAYTAKLESIFSQVSVLKAVSVWSLLETNSQGVSQQLSRRRVMAPALELACRSSHLAAYGHTLCFCPFWLDGLWPDKAPKQAVWTRNFQFLQVVGNCSYVSLCSFLNSAFISDCSKNAEQSLLWPVWF